MHNRIINSWVQSSGLPDKLFHIMGAKSQLISQNNKTDLSGREGSDEKDRQHMGAGRVLFPASWVVHTESRKCLVEILVSQWFLPKFFQFWLLFSSFQGKDHLYPIYSSSPEPVSAWCSPSICWVNEGRTEYMNSLNRDGFVSEIVF